MKHSERRHFLKLLGAGAAAVSLSPLELFIRSFVTGLERQAFAEITGSLPRNLVAISARGAPTRWGFDQWLNPGGETLIPNPMVATNFAEVSGRLVTPVYETFNYRGLTVPHIWGCNVPRAGGGTRVMSELLNNMLVIRGVDVADGGHEGAQKRMYMAPGNRFSLQGAVADASAAPLPGLAVQNNATPLFDYKSVKGLQMIPTLVNSKNMVKDVMKPFQLDNTKPTRVLSKTFEEDLAEAYENLGAMSGDLSTNLRATLRSADDIIRNGIGDLDAEWNTLKAKYTDLIARALAGVYPGLNDKPVGALAGRVDNNYRTGQSPSSAIVNHDDLRSMFLPTSSLGATASEFALAEYMITRGLTNSVSLNLYSLSGLSVDKNDPSKKENFNFDQHFCGAFMITYLSPIVFAAFSACLLELIDRLKAAKTADGKNVFEETVIQFGGEFNRTAPKGALGNDHSADSSSFSQWSGAISGPLVVGNIIDQHRNDYRRGQMPGTWGLGAISDALGGQKILTGNILSSMATLLRVPSPSTNNISLISVSGGNVISTVGPAKMLPYGDA